MAEAVIPRPPYIKGKGYCVNPVVKFGIPKEADSRRDKNVLGTAAWEKYWEEQLNYIHNGYQTGGLWVPGRYYYYMNFSVMGTIKGNITPDVTDLHLELANLIEFCKKNGKNIMIPKARRKGISEATHKMVIDYGWRFFYTYKAGVASGKKDFIDDFLAKLRYGQMYLPPELYVGKLLDNDDEIIAGYSEKNSHGAWEDGGTKNTLYSRTIHTDATGFKGNYYNDIIVEEVGETEKFLEFWAGTRDAMGDGAGKQVGTAYVYGTGGDINKGSKAFKEAWSRDAKNNFIDTNNFIRFVIPAQRFYYYGGASDPSRDLPLESDLFKKHKPYQLIGVEDIDFSIKDILKTREEKKNGPRKDYLEYLQNNPINEQEIFRKTVVNNFDITKLNDRSAELDALITPKYAFYKLEWVKDKKTGMIKQPFEVEAVPASKMDDPEHLIWILDEGFPVKNYTSRYVAGIDSYNIDTSKNSKSLGAMLVLDRMTKTPVAVINCRPNKKEIFFEMCLKLSVFYDMKLAVLGDLASDTIIKHFEVAGAYNYLADRPQKFESENSEQSHEKWVKLTTWSRPRMVGIMQNHIDQHIDKIWFPELINQLGNYDEVEINSDNDLADAYGIALMQDLSFDFPVRDINDEDVEDRFKLTEFITNHNGDIVPKIGGGGYVNPQEDNETFGLLFPGVK